MVVTAQISFFINLPSKYDVASRINSKSGIGLRNGMYDDPSNLNFHITCSLGELGEEIYRQN